MQFKVNLAMYLVHQFCPLKLLSDYYIVPLVDLQLSPILAFIISVLIDRTGNHEATVLVEEHGRNPVPVILIVVPASHAEYALPTEM